MTSPASIRNEMLRVRCFDCQRPWAATEVAHAADPRCPFCGSFATLTAQQVTRAIGQRAQRGWLYAA